LTLVVACRTEDYGCVNARLTDLIELRAELELWSEEDTADFLQKRTAGANRKKPIFSAEAAARLQELSQGVPRIASQLADLALVAGAGRQLEQIDAEAIESVYQELGAVKEEAIDA
jgi:type II secretory pathway predicted ATPase ExeA